MNFLSIRPWMYQRIIKWNISDILLGALCIVCTVNPLYILIASLPENFIKYPWLKKTLCVLQVNKQYIIYTRGLTVYEIILHRLYPIGRKLL